MLKAVFTITARVFDNFYIGKGSTFPLINGGRRDFCTKPRRHSAASWRRRTACGRFARNIRKHYRTSVASIEAAADLREDYLQYQRDFYASALEAADDHATQAWVFAAPGDPARMHLFADLLNYHRIETYRLARDTSVDDQRFAAADALIVPVAQPQFPPDTQPFRDADGI